MKKKIIYILAILFLSLGVGVFAHTIFSIDELFFTETGIFSGDYSPLHFNFSGNDFDGLMFWWTGISQTGQLELSGVSIDCDVQINGLYLNTARWNRMRPLDQETLEILSGSTSFTGYEYLELTGGFFTQCTGVSIDTGAIYGYIKHTYEWTEYEMWAGLDYTFPSWDPVSNWSGSLQQITFPNNTATGYIFDKDWWTAKVYSNMELYGDAQFTGDEVVYVDPEYITTWTTVKISIFSNKNANFEITWDVSWIFTWTLLAGIYNEVDVELLSSVNIEQDLVVTISNGSELITRNLSIILTDTISPTVSLVSPSNGSIITENELDLQWTGDDNIWISHYALYVTGNWISMSRPDIEYPTSTQNIPNIINGTYSWYVVATDYGANTWQSTTRTFTISGSILWPMLISPEDNSSVNIWELNLLWESVWSTNSWYTWQIATSNTFNNILASGMTNNTGVTVIHHPDLMTWLFYWRVINNETAWVSEKRRVNVSDLGITVDTQVNQFVFDTITGANLSQPYSSNEITIWWLTNNIAVLARLEDNIWALFINDIMVGSQWLVKNNDEVRIELISSDEYNNSVDSKLIIGTWNSLMSGTFEINTESGVNYTSGSFVLPYALRIQAILFVDSLAEMYQDNPQAFANFLTTFRAILQDRSDLAQSQLSQTTDTNEIAFLQLQKDSIDYLIFVVEEYLDDINYNIANIYIAPNGKQYLVQFDENRFAYTSPDFLYVKFFPTWELFKRHIDINNPGDYYGGWVAGDTITAPNGKTYTIHTENSKRTSNNMVYKKYFDTRDQIIEHIMINNPSTIWDHTIDTSFTPVVFVAPNGKSYTIFKTATTGNNANRYSSFMFVAPKYFGSLQAAKDHIINFNR
jgi:hypothetical protein